MYCFRLTIALLLAILSSGCSWIFLTKPPPRPVDATPPVQCATDTKAPAADLTTGLIFIPGGLLIAGASSLGNSNSGTAAGLATMAVGVVSLVSAGFGYTWTAECRELKSQQLGCLSGVEESCAALRVEPPSRPSTPVKER